jgi:decaprenylphospho-beta-D-erythro-pentofuranosid-2-ulose 2-reductase
MKHWSRSLIVWASSGIGKALAEKLLAEGCSVAMVARRVEPMEEIARKYPSGKASVYQHDVKNYEQVPALFQQITQDLGGLDVIVYASGVLPEVDIHEFNFAKDRETFEVNVFGAFAWLDEAAKRFERTKSGMIVGISSIAGERGRRENPPYYASKAAFSTFLESLRNRLAKYGVKVVTIKPGFVDTPMIAGKKLPLVITVDRAADLILRAMRRGANTAYVPSRWRLMSIVMHLMPSFIFRRLPI